MYKGETIEEWIPLTGKQGDEKEGNVNMIMSLVVSNINNCIMILVTLFTAFTANISSST